MSVQIEAGKYYRTRDGRKVGPMVIWDNTADHPWSETEGYDAAPIYAHDGSNPYGSEPLIAEWSDGPVRTETVTKRRIVPGVYGRLKVGQVCEVGDYNKPEVPTEITVEIAIQPWRPGYEPHFYDLNAEELDSLAMVASQLAEALRDQ